MSTGDTSAPRRGLSLTRALLDARPRQRTVGVAAPCAHDCSRRGHVLCDRRLLVGLQRGPQQPPRTDGVGDEHEPARQAVDPEAVGGGQHHATDARPADAPL
jgi:hypothetical protein